MNFGDAPAAVTLYASRRGWLGVILGFGLMTTFAISAAWRGSYIAAVVVLVLFGAALITVLGTQPVRTVVSAAGVERQCPLRNHVVAWEEIDAFERLRRGGGLVIRTADGKRRPICDRREGRAEHTAIGEGLAVWQPGVAHAEAPAIDQRPTNLYRRSKRTERGARNG